MMRRSQKLLDLARPGSQLYNMCDLSLLAQPLNQTRSLFGDGKVPEFFARPSQYTGGTNFLGTPSDHLKLLEKRPVSPHVFELDKPTQFHYKMPWGAVSSIANRGTGVALSAGFTIAGYVALTGDITAFIYALKAYPLVMFPLKTMVAFPVIYHYIGGLRHFVWDLQHIGNQTDKNDMLETPKVELSSQIILGASAAISLVLGVL